MTGKPQASDDRTTAPAPADLLEGVDRWRSAGEIPQRASGWRRRTWKRWLDEEHHSFLEGLPDRIDRDVATGLAARATADGGSAVQAFIVSMIWGYGPVGYGAYRTARVLRLNNEAPIRLQAVAEAARDEGPLAAYRSLARSPLVYLGQAFGTKYVYFCTRSVADHHDGRTAPVLDDVVRRWFRTHAQINLPTFWSVTKYETYVSHLESWGAQLNLPADQIEEIIFQLQVFRDGNRLWPEKWVVDSEPAGEAVDALEGLRAALEELGEQNLQEAEPHLSALRDILTR